MRVSPDPTEPLQAYISQLIPLDLCVRERENPVPNPARVLIPHNQAGSPASRLIQVYTVTKMCHHLVAAKIPLFLGIIENPHITSGVWSVSTHIWHSQMPLPIFFHPSDSNMDQPLRPKAGSFHPISGQIPPPSFRALLPDLHPQELGKRVWDPGSWDAEDLD